MRAVFCDFGNVIAFFDHRRITRRLVEFSRLPEDQIHAFIFGGELEPDYDRGRLTNAEFLARVREGCGLRCADDVLGRAWEDIFWPNEEFIALLPRLKKGRRFVLASNTNELHFNHFRRQFRAALDWFDDMVLSFRVGVRKPEAKYFRRCLEVAGCPAGECVFIDDLPANVAGAEAAGMHAVLYTGTADLRRRLAEMGVRVDDEAPLRPADGPRL